MISKKVRVPSTHPPSYEVADDVSFVTPNTLPKITRGYGNYTVIGCGKTGIDACLWLLSNGVEARQISWIMPRDAWYLKRAWMQPGVNAELAEQSAASAKTVVAAIAEAASPEDLYLKLEAGDGPLMRMTEKVWPETFHCATITRVELEAVRKIENIVRKGRITNISKGEVKLEKGSYTPAPDTLYIDCSSCSIDKRKPVATFNNKHITLQPVRYCQQVFSAAFVAHVEATYDDENLKNKLCKPVPHPDETIDWLVVNLQSTVNALTWAAYPKTMAWVSQSRLDIFRGFMPPAPKDPEEASKIGAVMKAEGEARCAKLRQLIDQLPEKDAAKAKAQIVGF